MFLDFVLNGQGHGPVGAALAGCQFEPGVLRPYRDENGIPCVTIRNRKTGKPQRYTVAQMWAQGINHPVLNATSLRKDEWIKLDTVVLKAARQRLRAWADLAGANSVGGFNGMAKTIYEYETMSDPGEAVVDMDGLTPGRNDYPKFQLEGIPLPITHSDFFFSARQLATSRNTGTPLDTTMAEAAGRRVAELIEKTLIGVETGVAYGDSTGYSRTAQVYGYTNFPARITKTDLTTPTGANPDAVMTDVLEMRDLLYGDNHYGPFVVYHSTGYDRYLDDDYFRSGGTSVLQTLRQRIESIDGVSAVRRLDFLTSGFQLIVVEMSSMVAQAINGMDITTVQWETKGGMQLNFKVMAIQVPLLRADFNGNTGIVHGTTS